jgi:hypothetical protein
LRDISNGEIKKDLEVSYAAHSLIKIDNHYFAIFDNLRIKSNNCQENDDYLAGNTLPIFFSDKYFHMLLDNVSLAEYSKSIIDSLNIQLFVVQYPIHEGLGSGNINSDPETFIAFLKNKRFNHNEFAYDDKNNFEYFKDISLIYNNKSFFYAQTMNVVIEKCFTFIGDDLDLLSLYKSDPDLYLQYYFSDGTRDYAKGYTDKEWVIKGIGLLKDSLKNQYSFNNKNRKVYISRSQASKLLKDNKDKEKLHRIIDKELFIEEAFKNNGFEIISFEGMSFLDQYKIINESSEMAGYNGTNLLNSVLSQSSIKVIEVRSSIYNAQFDYINFSKIFGNNHIFLSENDIMDVSKTEIWR